tara:strand:+ start:137 stop:340 length:204 start_codon:yes stop_codon:yes gene_type:complete
MAFFFMYLFAAVLIIAIYLILVLPEKQHKETVKEFKESNKKIIKQSKEQCERVKTRTRNIMKAENLK